MARTSLIIFQRSMRYTLRNPAWIILGLAQPLLYLALFGPLLTRLSHSPGFAGNTWRVFVPGLLIQQAVFASVFVGFGVIAEVRGGVLDRMKVTSASELGLVVGRVARDVVVLVTQAALLTVGALVAGLRASVGGVLLTFALLAVLGLAMSGLSYGLALRVPVEEVFGQIVNSLMLPILLLSGVLLPMALAPTWLADLSKANPLSHVVSGARALFAGRIASGDTAIGAAVAAGLAALALLFGLRAVRGTAD